jgi:hypothetical protein
MIFHAGMYLTIHFGPEAEESLEQAESQVPPNKQACKAQMRALLKRLGDTGRLNSPEQLRNEGQQIYAVKAHCGLRAYGFFAPGRKFVVSHFLMKKKDKLDPADREKALQTKANWKS